jgi:hypothetical protein
MTLNEILKDLDHQIFCEKHANEYDREWDAKKNLWSYLHRRKLELDENDNRVVHHKDGNHTNNSKKNLEALTRAEHCAIEKPAKKYDGCQKEGCNNKHFSHGLCIKHFFQWYRSKNKKNK